MISRTFMYNNKVTMLQLYKTLVRPKLEYCIQAWRPYLCKDIELLEKVQRRATKLMFSDKLLGYYDGLRKLGLTTLETWKLCGDIVEVFKIFKGFENVSYNTYFMLSQSGLRGHSFKLYKPNFRL